MKSVRKRETKKKKDGKYKSKLKREKENRDI